MAAGIGFRRVALALIASLLALGIPMVAGQAARADGSDRPSQSVALARVAVVRVLTYYYGTTSANPAPIPVLAPCASDGVLVGTTDQSGNLNSANYVLTPTAAVNPLVPCQGAQAAFQQLNGNATTWGITRIVVALNVSYTGTEGTQRGSITYSISPGLVTTNGGPGAPSLLALSLSNATGSPSHDLPVLSIPQPSDAPASGTPSVIDLTGQDGQPLNRDAVRLNEINDTLYPISVSANQIPQAPAAKSAAGTKTPATTAAVTPTAVGNSIGIGAAEVDSNGRLVGMVMRDSNGNHVLASLADVKKAIGSVSGHPGALMTAWQNGISAYYASPPNYDAATSAFRGLLSTAPDFAGAKPFLDAAQQHNTSIPPLTQEATPPPGSILPGLPTGTGVSLRTLLIVGGGVGAGVVVLAVVLIVLQRRRRARMPVYMPAPLDEAGLDLLPRDSMYEIPAIETPQAMPAVRPPKRSRSRPHSRPHAGEPDIEDMPTGLMPTMPPARSATGAPGARYTVPIPPDFAGEPRAPSQSRKNTSLMSYAAGLTHPGIRRANDPNQDNILALHGVRVAGSRPQPYGLFIVADGMGGHLNGQEASRLTIEIVTRTAMQSLNTSQPIDGHALSGVLREGVQQANNELRRRNINERADMGTTITAALIVDDQAVVVNVGDSRSYLMSPEAGLRQITTDHSVVASLVSAGVIRPEEIYTHPRRNQIYRSLGGEEEQVEIDVFPVQLQAGDKMLLCSDGLWEMVRDPQIEHILRATADPQQAAQLLVREANTNGGEDNISALVVRLLDDLPQNAQPGMRVIIAPTSAAEASQPHP
ncbi:MAG TPA: PP2C family serine/threonine-protein phosphatase [Ktedonobacterales bacterium]|jgi:serine/threonine protein phosphatase PrpC